jgi:uncharacterized RDD family membrane protein YckC
MMGSHDLGQGIFYAREDYAGFARRVAIILIDGLVLLFAGATIVMIWAVLLSGEEGIFPPIAWIVFAYLYLTLLRGSRFRTLGYILTRVRIVNLKGNRPAFFWMNLRLFFWLLGPINPLVDFLWLWGDPDRQMLRDKLAGTYVVRRDAKPIGGGPIRATPLFLMGNAFVVPEVIRSRPSPGTQTLDRSTAQLP